MLKKIFKIQPTIEEPVKEEPKSSGLAMGALFIGAISMLLVLAGLVINSMAEEKAHRDKWKDYDDYGWS